MSALAAIIRDFASLNEHESTSPGIEEIPSAYPSEQNEAGQAADPIAECGAVVLRSLQEISQQWLGAWQQVLASQTELLDELVENSRSLE